MTPPSPTPFTPEQARLRVLAEREKNNPYVLTRIRQAIQEAARSGRDRCEIKPDLPHDPTWVSAQLRDEGWRVRTAIAMGAASYTIDWEPITTQTPPEPTEQRFGAYAIDQALRHHTPLPEPRQFPQGWLLPIAILLWLTGLASLVFITWGLFRLVGMAHS